MNEMNYSFYVKNKQVNNHKNRLLYAQNINQNNYWQPDSQATKCNNCNEEFKRNWYEITSGKHHCRLCGKIFCLKCSNYFDMIPKELTMEDKKSDPKKSIFNYFYSSNDKNLLRTCVNCHELLVLFENMIKVNKMFQILNLNILQINKLKEVCQIWFYSARYLQSIFRQVQYKLPYQKYTSIEKKLLWANIDLLSGHRKYLLHMFKICENDEQVLQVVNTSSKIKHVNCWDLMCSSSCREKLQFYDLINLYVHYINFYKNNKISLTTLLDYIIENMQCTDVEFKNCIILLTYYSQYEPKSLIKYKWSEYRMQNYLIERSMHNLELMRCLYYEVKYNTMNTIIKNTVYYVNFKNSMESMLKNANMFSKFTDCDRLIDDILLVYNFTSPEQFYDENKGIKYDDCKTKSPSPLNFNNNITDIHVKSSSEFVSKTRPIRIPYSIVEGTKKHMIFKKENIRQDQIASNIINLINDIILNNSDIDPSIVTYELLPLNANKHDPYEHRGIIEMVDSCDTVINISMTHNNILAYLIKNNTHVPPENIIKNFTNSCAAYSVITYLLGTGDRHMGNILVTKDGKLFHIDYGFILGQNPLNVGTMCRGEIRLTSNMLEVIGNEDTPNFLHFQELCKKIYEICRYNVDILSLLLLLIPKICPLTNMDEQQTIEFIDLRFALNMSTEEAQKILIEKLKVFPLADLYDYFKERTGGSNPSEAIKNGTFAVLNSISEGVNFAFNHVNYLYSWYTNKDSN